MFLLPWKWPHEWSKHVSDYYVIKITLIYPSAFFGFSKILYVNYDIILLHKHRFPTLYLFSRSCDLTLACTPYFYLPLYSPHVSQANWFINLYRSFVFTSHYLKYCLCVFPQTFIRNSTLFDTGRLASKQSVCEFGFGEGKNFSSLQRVQACSGSHVTFYSVGTCCPE